MPDLTNIKKILTKINKIEKIQLLEEAGKVHKVGSIYVQLAGITLTEAKKILKVACTRSLIPEPLRAAHLIGAGVIKGESKGRA